MKRVTVYLTDEQVDTVKHRARIHKTTVSAIIRFSIDQYIMPSDVEKNAERRRAAWGEFLKSNQGIISDVMTPLLRRAFFWGYDRGWVLDIKKERE